MHVTWPQIMSLKSLTPPVVNYYTNILTYIKIFPISSSFYILAKLFVWGPSTFCCKYNNFFIKLFYQINRFWDEWVGFLIKILNFWQNYYFELELYKLFCRKFLNQNFSFTKIFHQTNRVPDKWVSPTKNFTFSVFLFLTISGLSTSNYINSFVANS